jgi:RNA polymerase sigma factor (sigma-70 family)
MATPRADPLVHHLRQLAGQKSSQSSDRELLSRFIARRDEAAFTALVQRHGPLVWRVCRRTLANTHDAEDAFQATFLVLSRKANTVRRQESLGNWLYGVALRIALKARKAAARRPAPLPVCPEGKEADPLAEVSVREAQAILDDELARLPDKHRAPLVLCCLEGATRDEAARQLGWSPSLVKSRLEEGRERLRRRLVRRGLPLPAGLAAVLLAEGISPAAAPLGLVQATLKAVFLIAAGQALRRAVSADVAALVEGAGRFLASTQTKLAALLLSLGLFAAGVGMDWYPASTPGQPPGAHPVEDVKAQPARTDSHGDPLPARAAARLGTVRWRPGEGVFIMAYAADGKTLITQGWDAITFWDVATGKAIRRLHKPSGETLGNMAVSSDGKKVLTVTAFKGIMDLWEVPTGKHLVRLDGRSYAAVLSPDGKTVASRDYGKPDIRLWDAETGRGLRRLTGHEGRLWTLAFSGDGQTLASGGSDKTIRFWDVATGKERHAPVRHSQSIGLIALSPDGGTVAAIDLYGDDGKCPTCSKGYAVHWWDTATGKKLHQFPETAPRVFGGGNFLGSSYGCNSLAFSRDGTRIVTGEIGRRHLVLDVARGTEVCRLPESFGSSSRGAVFSPDGKVLATEVGNTICLWEVATGKEILTPSTGHQGAVNTIAFRGDGRRLVTGGSDGTLREWEVGTGREVQPAADAGWWISKLALAPDGRTLAAAEGQAKARLWDLAGRRALRQLPQPVCDALAFAPDGKVLAAASYKTVCLWDATTGQKLRQLPEHPERVQWVRFSSDGRRLFAWTNAKTLHVWEVGTGKELHRLACPGRDNQPEPGVVSPDGKLLAWAERYATNRPGRIRLYDIARGYEVRRLPGPDGAYTCLAFSPDGRTLAAADQKDTHVHLWELASGKERARFVGHQGQINALAFSPDGKRLASASEDTTALIWNVGEPAAGMTPVTADELRTLWDDLASADATRAFQAIARLAAVPRQSVPFLRERLTPATPLEAARTARLIADLGAERFSVREQASADLLALGESARPAVERALRDQPTLEVRRRLEAVREKIDQQVLSSEALRGVRAVEALERIGTSEAKQVLKRLARGAGEARLTQEAAAALDRLDRRGRS